MKYMNNICQILFCSAEPQVYTDINAHPFINWSGVYEPGISLLVIAVCVFLMQILYSHRDHITTIFTVPDNPVHNFRCKKWKCN